VTYTPRLSARAHQTEALQKMQGRPTAFALLMEMGTGKSKVILDEWGQRVDAGELSQLLIIAPAGSYANWFLDRGPSEPSEATKQLDPELRARMSLYHWSSAGGAGYAEGLRDFMQAADRPRMFVMNIEALSSVDRARAACEAFIASGGTGRTLLCVDESTKIKTPDTERTRYVNKLGRLAAVRRIATGLVAPRSPMDLYCQFYFLDWNIIGCKSFTQFRALYAITHKQLFVGRRYPTEIIDGYRNLDQLAALIAPWSFRRLKEECLDLPPKVYQTRDIELTDAQRKAYKELRQFATTQLSSGEHVTALLAISQILRLHQLVCGYLVDEQGGLHAVAERRTDALIELLEEHDGKAIIWVTYEYSLTHIMQRLQKEFGPGCAAAFWGGNRAQRLDEETRWKTDPQCRFIVATQGAGGLGNNWVQASLVVYYANSYDLELRSQSEDRAHRDGLMHRVTYVDLVARGTVDEKILQALRDKIDLATAITNENYKTWVI